jgi:hypothetical protein
LVSELARVSRDYGHQTVADRQHRISLKRTLQIESVLQHTNQEARENIDDRDNNRCHRVALGKTGGAIHGAIELGFAGQHAAARAGFVLIDQT